MDDNTATKKSFTFAFCRLLIAILSVLSVLGLFLTFVSLVLMFFDSVGTLKFGRFSDLRINIVFIYGVILGLALYGLNSLGSPFLERVQTKAYRNLGKREEE